MSKKEIKLKFYPKSHKYKIGKKELCSVTRWVKSFFPVFDEKSMSIGTAKKLNLTPEQVRAMWDTKRKAAAALGTNVHKQVELFLTQTIEPAELRAVQAVDFIQTYSLQDHKILSEHVVHDEELGLAGTIDCFIPSLKLMVDWKTNQEIKQQGYKGATGFGACKELQDANYQHYMLQMSTYSYILHRQGIHVTLCMIVHLTDTSWNVYDFKPNFSIVEKMLEERNGYETIKKGITKTISTE